jgi:hypothetical protein
VAAPFNITSVIPGLREARNRNLEIPVAQLRI